MKQFFLVACGLLILGTGNAQNKVANTKKAPISKKAADNKIALGGTLKNMRKQAIVGAQAFVYAPNGSIVASGYTDEMGYFETNALAPGKYDLKVVYPSEKMAKFVGVEVGKKGITKVTINMNEPTADTIMTYATIAPPEAPKKTKGLDAGAPPKTATNTAPAEAAPKAAPATPAPAPKTAPAGPKAPQAPAVKK